MLQTLPDHLLKYPCVIHLKHLILIEFMAKSGFQITSDLILSQIRSQRRRPKMKDAQSVFRFIGYRQFTVGLIFIQ